jgi:SAM-dependent methyltransferase
VQADAENLPFPDGAFDVVYGCAALHHALDLRMVSRWPASPGWAASSPGSTRAFAAFPRPCEPRPGRKELGINEHVHTVWAYAGAFRRTGLRVRRIERAEGWPPVPWGGLLTRIPKVGLTAGTLVHLSAATYASASVYARKPA